MYHKKEALAMLLVVGMVAVAEYFGVQEIIFPEIAALAFGAWVMEERPWPGPIWTIWFSPTLGALTGVALLRFLPLSLVALTGLAFVFVLLQLKITRSTMSPSFSAAILPIITGIHSWVYPASVFLMTVAIALVTQPHTPGDPTEPSCPPQGQNTPPSLAWSCRHYGKILFLIMVVALFATTWGGLFMMAPPLIVAFIELTHPGSALRQKSMPRLLLLFTGCALAGAACIALVTRAFSGPMWLGAGLSLASALAIAKGLRLASPPAMALALLPTILPREVLTLYPLQVLAGSAIFIALSHLWFKPEATD